MPKKAKPRTVVVDGCRVTLHDAEGVSAAAAKDIARFLLAQFKLPPQTKAEDPMMPTTFYDQIVGQLIRGRRECSSLSLAEMADAAGFGSASGWSRVETGDTTMTMAHLRSAAIKLGVEPWVLVQQADSIASRLKDKGAFVLDHKPDASTKTLRGAGILALLAEGTD